MSEHGTLGYRRGCRCDVCKACIASYQAERRRARATTPGKIPHGTTGGYTNYSCRCAGCTRAQADAVQAYRTRPLSDLA